MDDHRAVLIALERYNRQEGLVYIYDHSKDDFTTCPIEHVYETLSQNGSINILRQRFEFTEKTYTMGNYTIILENYSKYIRPYIYV